MMLEVKARAPADVERAADGKGDGAALRKFHPAIGRRDTPGSTRTAEPLNVFPVV